MKANIQNLLIEGVISNLSIGSKIPKSKDYPRLQIFKKQEGDIPALYEIKTGGVTFVITSLNRTIVGLSLKLADYPNKSFRLFRKNKASIGFGYNSSLPEFIAYLNDSNMDWYFYHADTDEQSIGVHLTKSGFNILYSFKADYWCCYRIYAFDRKLYEKLAEKVHQKQITRHT